MANPRSRTANGWLLFAAVMIFIVGCHNIIYGIAALGDYAVVVQNLANGQVNVLYADTTFWGWLWITVGIVEVVTAFAIATGNQIARWIGVTIAALNAIGQLAFLSAYPIWSVVIIALDVLVIYALMTYDQPPHRAAYEPYPGDEQRVGAGQPGMGYGAHAPSETAVRTGRTAGERGHRPPAR
jgi:hypothetical protein